MIFAKSWGYRCPVRARRTQPGAWSHQDRHEVSMPDGGTEWAAAATLPEEGKKARAHPSEEKATDPGQLKD